MKYADGDSKWHSLLHEEQMGTLEWLDKPPYRQRQAFEDSVPHYITYNADTRVLNLYPNVMVLEDADVADAGAFARRLAGAPHFLHVPLHADLVRQMFVRVASPHVLELPHTCSVALRKLHAECGAREG